MDALVFDTSAIFNFGHRGELEFLLDKLLTEFHLFTTDQVCAEFRDPKRANYYGQLVKKHFKVQSAKSDCLPPEDFRRLAGVLGGGEVSVIVLAKQLKAKAVLDEKTARKEALKLGLAVLGTLGLLHHGLGRGWLSDEDCLSRVEKMRRGGFSIPRPGANQNFADYFLSFPN